MKKLDCFEKMPALFYGLSFFLGVELAFHPGWALILPLCCILYLNLKSAWLAILVAIAGFCYTQANYHFTAIDPEGVEGVAKIRIDSVSCVKTRFGKNLYYKGTLLSFKQKEGALNFPPKNIPISFKLRSKKNLNRPLADGIYLFPCHLFPSSGMRYRMKLNPKLGWRKIKSTYSMAENRSLAKQKVSAFIKKCFTKTNSQDFLAGLVTGEFNEERIKNAFCRFGLLHLMAISGFHFSLFSMILIFFLRPFVSPYKTTAIVTLILTAYFLFLGNGPSILRAWMMALAGFGTLLSKRPVCSRNTLGFALFIVLFFDPSLCNHLGFQFSFLITAAILFGCPIMEEFMLKVFPKKAMHELEDSTIFEKHILLILGFFRSILALNIVTTIAALPLSLHYFQQFPLLSFVYNLFFPILVSISMLLLMLGISIPLISSFLHFLNDHFTNFVLNMAIDVPKKYDIFLTSGSVSANFLILFYSIFFTFIIYFHYKYNKENQLSFQKLNY